MSPTLICRRTLADSSGTAAAGVATPDWTAVLNVTQQPTALQARETNPGTLAIHTKQTLNAIIDDLAALGLTPPSPSLHGSELWTWADAFT